MRPALGIDTGGTYTDAVVVDLDTEQVLATAKAFTTRYDLTVGIRQAIGALQGVSMSLLRLVSLSTTLATNAIVEGKGGRVCLLLVGYDPYLLKEYGLEKELPTRDYYLVAGGHTVEGNEAQPLDLEEARKLIEHIRDSTEAFAVSSYFSVRNPEHELRLKWLIRELTGKPVVCGHEMARELHSIKRATTAALNARLIPTLKELFDSVETALKEMSIHAPLMVVKGDGSLVSAAIARERPIDTVFSGPAASAIGAQFLSRQEASITVDMGGTTTDIAHLEQGQAQLTGRGAIVGGWHTSIKAADVRTIGVGGDSRVWLEEGNLRIGPQRAIPLCRAAAEKPSVLNHLKQLASFGFTGSPLAPPYEFLTLLRSPDATEFSAGERALVEALATGPLPLQEVAAPSGKVRAPLLHFARLEHLEVVARIGITPTDILHAEGSYAAWDREAAKLGVAMLASMMGIATEELIAEVKEAVADRIATEILTELISHNLGDCSVPGCPVCGLLIDMSLGGKTAHSLESTLRVTETIVGVGAAATAYLPKVAQKLHTKVIIPPHAAVANALGAIMGKIVKTIEVFIYPAVEAQEVLFRLHSPAEKMVFSSREEATSYGARTASELARGQALESGAGDVQVQLERKDMVLGEVFLETHIIATATGLPRYSD